MYCSIHSATQRSTHRYNDILFQVGVAYTVTQNNTEIQLYSALAKCSIHSATERITLCRQLRFKQTHHQKKLQTREVQHTLCYIVEHTEVQYQLYIVLAISSIYIQSATKRNTQGYHSINRHTTKKEQTRDVQYIGKINYQF